MTNPTEFPKKSNFQKGAELTKRGRGILGFALFAVLFRVQVQGWFIVPFRGTYFGPEPPSERSVGLAGSEQLERKPQLLTMVELPPIRNEVSKRTAG